MVFIDFSQWNVAITKVLSPKSAASLFLYVLSIILEGIFSSDLKAVLVFWKIKNPLPGSRAFTDVASKDPRIDFEALKRIYSGKLPATPQEQNTAWYSLYKKYAENKVVLESHRWFLLMRDMVALTVVLIPINIIGYLILCIDIKIMYFHILVLMGLYFLISQASRNYGNRFVANVLVEAISKSGN